MNKQETYKEMCIKLKAAIKKTEADLRIYQEKARENRDEITIGECIRILKENTEGLV